MRRLAEILLLAIASLLLLATFAVSLQFAGVGNPWLYGSALTLSLLFLHWESKSLSKTPENDFPKSK